MKHESFQSNILNVGKWSHLSELNSSSISFWKSPKNNKILSFVMSGWIIVYYFDEES